MSTFDKLTYLIGADSSEFREELEKANRGFDRFRRRNSRTIRRVKRAIIGGTAAVTALGAAMAVDSTRSAARFERSLVSAGSKADATARQLQQMKEAALEASGASEFSAGQAADAMGYLAQAGFEVEQQIAALPGVLNLASAGELELAEAADIASNVLSGFGQDVEQLGRVNDVLVKAANSANTSVQQLGNAMSYAAPTATGAGVAVEETAAIIGKLSDAGIQGSRAGRGFNQILVQMRDVAGALGVEMSAADIEADGFAGSLEKLEDAGLTAGNAVEHFGREAGPAIQAILNQGVGSVDDLTSSLEEAGGTAERVANDKIDTMSGALNVLTGNWENLKIVIGDQFLPLAQEAAKITAEWLEELRDSPETLLAFQNALVDTVELVADLTIAIGGAGEALAWFKGRSSLLAEPSFETLDERIEEVDASAEAFGENITGVGHRLHNFAARARSAQRRLQELREEQDLYKPASAAFNQGVAESVGLGGPIDWQGVDASPEPESKKSTGKSAAQKEREELERLADTMRGEVQTSFQKYAEEIENLDRVYEAGLVSGEEYAKIVEHLKDEYEPATIEANKLRTEADRLRDSLAQVDDSFVENLGWLEEMFEEGEISAEEFRQGLEDLQDSASAFDELSRGAERLKEDLKSDEEKTRELADSYKEMLDEQLISEEQYNEALAQLRDGADEEEKRRREERAAKERELAKAELEEQQKLWEEGAKGLISITDTVSGHFFDKLIDDADSAKDKFLLTVGQMVTEAAAKFAILSAFQGVTGADAGSIIGSVTGFASGGHVRGPGTSTSDSIPAMLSNDEFVMPAAATRQYGLGFMEAVRQGKFAPQHFAQGGHVGGGSSSGGGGDGGGSSPTTVNFVSQDLLEQFLASQRGSNAMLNWIGAHRDEIDGATR